MQILSTKLSIPPLRSRLVQRPRLLQKLSQGLECGFVLISAPAGYGKTTLLTSWLSQTKYLNTWLSIDDSDNEPTRFLTYLAAALQKIDPKIGYPIESTSGFDSQLDNEAYLTKLINGLDKLENPFYLILDEYHAIQNQTIHQVVNFLLENRPPAMHIIIATRADPPLRLARLRARSDMLELRLADLRFIEREAADFLNYTMGLKVTPEDVARITQRTEGWIAGLQMAALSMQNAVDISGFITNLTGSHHYIFDYLIEEILMHQTPEVHRFLLYTSILEQLTAPLCDAILELENRSLPPQSSSAILDELEHANLFIIPLDNEQRWYRYHPLFGELLRGYLQQTNANMLPVLHSRASSWFEGQGLYADAIRHLFAAKDWEGVVRLVSANIFAMLEQNELNSVARQLDSLMGEKSSARPWLLMGRAWLAAYTGRLNSVEPILRMAEYEISSLSNELELQTLGGHIAAIRAYTNWIENRRDIAVSAARAALEWLPETEHLIRCQAATLLGLSEVNYNDREQALKQALSSARECSVSHVSIFAHGCWAWALAMRGRLREAYAACQEAIQLAQSAISHQPLPTLSHVYSTLSFILCEWNDLEGALHYANEAVDLARHWEQADALHFALDNLGSALFSAGEIDEAFKIHNQAWQVARRTSTWFEEITIAQGIEWYLAQDNLEAVVAQFHLLHVDSEEAHKIPLSSYKSIMIPFLIVQSFIAQKQYTKALFLVEVLLEDMGKKAIGYYFVRALILQALIYQGLKQDSQALSSLKHALTLAAPEGYIRTFTKLHPGLINLLRQAHSSKIMPDYVAMLLASFEQGVFNQPIEVVNPIELIDPLSEREMEVLMQLAQGCTDKKIAENLVIARETVHKHLKNIYNKLDVHSRTEAIVRARELKLL